MQRVLRFNPRLFRASACGISPYARPSSPSSLLVRPLSRSPHCLLLTSLGNVHPALYSIRHASTTTGTSSKASEEKSSGSKGNGAKSGEKDTSKPEAQPVEKPAIGKFHKYAREHGVFFAVYFLTVCELFAWLLTFLVHKGYIAGGDCANLVAMLGASNYVDVEGWANASVNVFGLFELTGRLALNYFVCSSIAPVAYPALLPLCLATAPGLKRVVFFWRTPAAIAAKAA